MNCSACEIPIETTGINCVECGQKTHENCGSLIAVPKLDEGSQDIIFYCLRCKPPAHPFSPNCTSVENSPQTSVKAQAIDYASSYSETLSQIEFDSKVLPKFDLKARKSIMEEFFEVEDKAPPNAYSWIACCKICRRDNSSTKSRQGKLKISKGSTRTIITHLIAYHNEEFQHFREHNPHLQSPRQNLISKTNINNVKSMHREVMNWIVHSNQDFSTLEDPYLLNLLATLQNFLPGSHSHKSFPRADVFRKNLSSMHADLEHEKTKALSNLTSRVAITVDIWTTKNQIYCLGITGHWIDTEFNLQNVLLGFIPLQGPLHAAALAQIFAQVVEKHNIVDKISSITLENSTLHEAFIQELVNGQVLPPGYYTSKDNLHKRCLTHVIHLIAQTLVLAYDKVMLTSEAPLQHFLVDFPPSEVVFDEEGLNESLVERPLEFLRRILTSLRDNAAYRELLEKFQLHEGLEASSPPITDIRAKWSSTYTMVKWAFGHRQVITSLLGNNNVLADHWNNLEEFQGMLGELDTLAAYVSAQKSMSLATSFISIESQVQKLDQLIQTHGETSSFGAALYACRLKVLKYLPFFESDLHLIATILHPRAKVAYFDVIKPNLKERALAAVTEIFAIYNAEPQAPAPKKYKPNPYPADILSKVFERIHSQTQAVQDELESYLASNTENSDILIYWKKHQTEFPVLAKIARDVFAIQGNSAASEFSFNSGIDFKQLQYSDLSSEEYRMLKEAQDMLRPSKFTLLS